MKFQVFHLNSRSGKDFLWQVKGLYRGATSSFVGVAFESSLLFGIYSQTKQSLQVWPTINENAHPWLDLLRIILFWWKSKNELHAHHLSITQRGLQTDRPQPQVIIPSAAFGGAIISFVLCPSELVKVCWLIDYYSHNQAFSFQRWDLYISGAIFHWCWFFSVGCKSKALTPLFETPGGAMVLLTVPLKPWQMKGWVRILSHF